MIAWMLYCVVVAAIIVIAGRAAEWLARAAVYPVRWVWAGALALAISLSAWTLLRSAAPAMSPAVPASSILPNDATDARETLSWRNTIEARVESLHRSLNAPLGIAAGILHRRVSPVADVYAVALASLLSFGLAGVLAAVARRFRRARRAWPVVRLQGVDVRVAPSVGPLVLGLLRPEIIVPRWILHRDPAEQRLVVAHESEHVRARDPLLLGFAWGVVLLLPWNPASWYMLSRLRLAIELDCDARVLHGGAAPRSYGTLLIDVVEHASSLRPSALALADGSSHLKQRLLAMKHIAPRFARFRGGLAATVALAGVLVACQATLPTDADVEQMDGASAARAARGLASASGRDTALVYVVDGVKVTAVAAKAIAPSAIASVDVVKGTNEAPSRVEIHTLAATQAPATTADGGKVPIVLRPATAAFTGLIFIDGARATQAEMRALDASSIESVEVVKGPAAASRYDDPAAARGVITITTKRGGPSK